MPFSLNSGSVAVIGLPSDEHSSFLRGAAQGPARIREALHSPSSNLCAENGLDLGAEKRWQDVGDAPVSGAASFVGDIEGAVGALLDRGARVLSLGGDHAVTYPILRAYARRYPGLSVLDLDAHPDLYDQLDGDRHSHACPFARAMEEGLIARLVQVGIRTQNPHQRQQAERFGVRIVEARGYRSGMDLGLRGPLYLSLDLDVLDPAFAPGVSHHEPGGLSTRDVLGIVQHAPGPVVGADIVELNPSRDPLGMTAMVAAKCAKDLLARLLEPPVSAPLE